MKMKYDPHGMKTILLTIATAGLLAASGCTNATKSGGVRKPAAEADADERNRRVGDDGDRRKKTPLGPSGEPTVSYKPFSGALTDDQMLDWVAADKTRRGEDARFYRYAYLPLEFLRDSRDANYARIGLSKAMNSVAIAATDIVSPEDVSDGHGVVFALDLRAYWGDRGEQKWDIAARAQPKDVFSPAPRLDLAPFDANLPVAADRLAYNVMHGGIYNQLIDTPEFGQELIRDLGARNVTARSAVKNAITYSPRYLQRRQLPNRPGAYWESFDDFDGNRREIPWITGNPIPDFRGDGMLADFGTVASEAWVHMPNGLPAYYIWGNANQERTKAELSFVLDPMNHKGNDLITGMSCINCHISGVQTSPNDMRVAIDQDLITQDLEQAKAFWTASDVLAKQYAEDRRIVVAALRKIVLGVSDGDAPFNDDLVNGVDEHEPTLFLISSLTSNPLRGDTTGRRRRDVNGNLEALE